MPRPLASALLAFFACAGCGREHLNTTTSSLSAVPQHVTSSRHFVGQSWTESVSVLNGGEVALPVTWTVDPPVRAAGLPAVLEPGETKVALTLTASRAGPFTSAVVVDTPGLSASISIDGVIQDIPACDAGACQVASFDLDAGACALAPAADGTSCADPCLDQPACLGGQCVGAAHSCDDGNACTTDACDARSGCVHVPVVCPTLDACHVATCDPSSGCGTAVVQDGTQCGPSNWLVAQVCLNGTCQSEPRPSGPCQPTSPCGAVGWVDDAGVCEATGSMLPLAWSYQGPLGSGPSVDEEGNVYWFENVAQVYSLVSADFDGGIRFRHRIDVNGSYWSYQAAPPILPVGVVVPSGDSVRLLDRASGNTLWEVDLTSVVQFADGGAACSACAPYNTTFAARGARIAAGCPCIGNSNLGWLVLLNANDGTVMATESLGIPTSVTIDAQDRIVVRSADEPSDMAMSFRVFDSSGQPLVEIHDMSYTEAPLDTAAGLLALEAGPDNYEVTLWDERTGAPLDAFDAGLMEWAPWVTSGSSVWGLAQGGRPRIYGVAHFDLESWALDWTVNTALSAPLLFANGDLGLKSTVGGNASIHFVSQTDSAVVDCPVPLAPDSWGFGSTMHGSRYFGRTDLNTIFAVDLPGYSLAPTGWVTPGGNPGYSNAAR